MGKTIRITESQFKRIIQKVINEEGFGDDYIEYNGRKYISTHRSPFDRGTADSYYHRDRDPHKGGVGGDSGPRITDLSDDELDSYHAGYDYNEEMGDKKDWGDDDFNDHFDDDDF